MLRIVLDGIESSRLAVALGHEVLEAGLLLRCGPLRGMEPLGIGQAGPDHVDGPAQVRVGFGLQAIGPGQAPVDLVLGWSQRRHHPERAVHAQLVGAVTATPGLRRSADAGGEPRAVGFHLHGVAAGGDAERPVTLGHDGKSLHRRRLVVLGPAGFGIEGVQVGVLHVLPGIPGDRRIGAAAGQGPA